MEGVTAMSAVFDEACLHLCSYQALSWVASNRLIVMDPCACYGCGTWMTGCPKRAISTVARAR